MSGFLIRLLYLGVGIGYCVRVNGCCRFGAVCRVRLFLTVPRSRTSRIITAAALIYRVWLLSSMYAYVLLYWLICSLFVGSTLHYLQFIHSKRRFEFRSMKRRAFQMHLFVSIVNALRLILRNRICVGCVCTQYSKWWCVFLMSREHVVQYNIIYVLMFCL